MKLRMDPLVTGILILLLGYGLTEVTSEPSCEKTIVSNNEKYTIPFDCEDIPLIN